MRTSAEILVGNWLASNSVVYPTPDSPFKQPPPHGFNIGPQRRHAADAGHYNASSHKSIPFFLRQRSLDLLDGGYAGSVLALLDAIERFRANARQSCQFHLGQSSLASPSHDGSGDGNLQCFGRGIIASGIVQGPKREGSVRDQCSSRYSLCPFLLSTLSSRFLFRLARL